ncbi:MAG: hypothetical protein OEV00_05110, partial [Acidobacteriota bacterium]|nr:hypothetical protein [Acidobacteriota bacterium]
MNASQRLRSQRQPERGSSMVVAIFVLAMVTTLGVALLFLTRNETQLAQADTRSKRVYYVSEAGLEDGRATVANDNRFSANPKSYNEELVSASGGLLGNGSFDFGPTRVRAVYDS